MFTKLIQNLKNRIQGFKDSRGLCDKSHRYSPWISRLQSAFPSQVKTCYSKSPNRQSPIPLLLTLTLTLWLAGCGGSKSFTPAPTGGTVSGQAIVPAQNMAALPESSSLIVG